MGYPVVPIGSLCHKTGVRDPRKKPNDGFLYVDIASIDRESKTIGAPTQTLGGDAPSRARKVIRHRDVIVATVRPNLNAVALVPSELDDQIASTGFAVLRPDETRLSSDYLYQWVKMPAFIEQLMAEVRGAQYPAVSDSDVLGAGIPLPPLEEQRRIADLLDEADRLQRLRKEANEKAQRILPALFLDMFGDPQSNPMGWEVRPLGDVCEMRSGGTPSRKNRGYYGGDIPWAKIGDLDSVDGVVASTTESITESGLAAIRGRVFPRGTVLLAMYASVGKTAIAGIPLSMNQAILGMSPTQDVLDSMYLWQFLRASQSALVGKVNEGTQKNISATIVRAHPIPLPPIDKQRAFAVVCSGSMGLHGLQADAATRQSHAVETLRSRLFAETA